MLCQATKLNGTARALVAQFEYLEWTPDYHLRHARFIALRDDKDPRGRKS
jgi:ATP-dependent DNA ligase